jgi:LysM repeat protein
MASSPQVRRRAPVRQAAGLLIVVAVMLAGSAGYTVRAGDTLWAIASRHGLSLSSLVSANQLSNPNVIHPGQQLAIPGGATAGSGGTVATGTNVHVVASGETLMGISIHYGVTMRRIADANGITSLNLVYAGQRLRIPSGTAAAAAPTTSSPTVMASGDVGTMLEQTAQRYGFTPAFIKAIAYQESGWNQGVRSSAGAVGVMQVLPSTGDFVARYVVGRPLDVTKAQDNITAGVAFVDYLWQLTGGDVRKTLAGYYQGLASVRSNGMYPSTKQYIANVLALRDRFS